MDGLLDVAAPALDAGQRVLPPLLICLKVLLLDPTALRQPMTDLLPMTNLQPMTNWPWAWQSTPLGHVGRAVPQNFRPPRFHGEQTRYLPARLGTWVVQIKYLRHGLVMNLKQYRNYTSRQDSVMNQKQYRKCTSGQDLVMNQKHWFRDSVEIPSRLVPWPHTMRRVPGGSGTPSGKVASPLQPQPSMSFAILFMHLICPNAV